MAESRVLYGPVGDQSRLIPAPLITISKAYQRTGSGEVIGKTYTITVTGTIVAYMGSPLSDGTFYKLGGYPANEDIDAEDRLRAVMRKQQALRELFQLHGGQFEVYSGSGFSTLRCYPRIVSIEFPEDIWYERSNYTITMECDEIYGIGDSDEFSEYIESATEEWSIDTNEDPQAVGASTTFTLTHNISAVGKTFYDITGAQPREAWQYAEQYVLARLGFDAYMAMSSGVNDLPSYYHGWNHLRSNQVDKKGGGFSVSESWLLASGVAIEDFTITTTSDIEAPHQRVSIQGNVTGFEERQAVGGKEMKLTTTKWANAQTKFAWASGVAYTRAKEYSGLTNLNVKPLTLTVGRNPLRGTIDYTIDYDTRPLQLIEGAKSEVLSINDNIGGELFASVFVLGRTAGPVLQDLGTKPANTRDLNIEIVVDPPTIVDRTSATMREIINDKKPSQDAQFSTNLTNIIEAANPSYLGATTIFQDQPQETWNPLEGRYTYTTRWTYE